MKDRIAKESLNIILLVDASKSMCGKRIEQVDSAIKDINKYLVDLQTENSNDFSFEEFNEENTFNQTFYFYKDSLLEYLLSCSYHHE